jgi:3-methyladenine DNA glycosylase AlkC
VDSPQDPSVAAEQARARLHEEIERVRAGVEEMLAEQGGDHDHPELRRELDALREDTRLYVKKRLGKSEKRTEKRFSKLERRIDQVEADRQHAEWRIHTNTEAMLDGLLKEVRAIADLLTRTR